MPVIRFILTLLLMLTLAGCASAGSDESKLPERQAGSVPQKKQVPRRAVPALIDRTPSVATPAPQVTAPLPPVPQTAVPSGPAPVTGCDPGGCWSGGNRYNGGAGGTYLDKGGRLCQSNGTWMQCF